MRDDVERTPQTNLAQFIGRQISATRAEASTRHRLNSSKHATFPTGLAVAGIPTYCKRSVQLRPSLRACRGSGPCLGALRRRVGAVLGRPFGKGLALEGEFFAEARMKIAGDATDADMALLRDFQGNIVAALQRKPSGAAEIGAASRNSRSGFSVASDEARWPQRWRRRHSRATQTDRLGQEARRPARIESCAGH